MESFKSQDSIDRNKNLKMNVILGFTYKILAVGISFLIVPLTINYLDKIQYGVWVTLISIMSWINYFDIGLGNGLRNKLTEAIGHHDTIAVRTLISTAYFVVGGIALVILVLVSGLLPFISLPKVFNTYSISNDDLFSTVFVYGLLILCIFVVSLINQIYYAYQKASLVGLVQLVSNGLVLVSIYCVVMLSEPNILYLAISYGSAILFTNLGFSIYFFRKNLDITPNLKYVDRSQIASMSNLGLKFFIIQIAVLVIFSTANLLISQILGPEHIQAYDVAFKLFGVISLGHNILLTPFWSAFTEAYQNNDFKWIKRSLINFNLLMIPILVVTLLVARYASEIVRVWIGIYIEFPPNLINYMAIYTIVTTWNNIYSYFLNGISKIQLQMYLAIAGAAINIPIAIYFTKYAGMGSSGVLLASIISLSFFSIIGPIQTYLIVNNHKAK